MELRAHQIAAIAAIEVAAAAGERRMTVVCACGTGKTLIAIKAAQSLAEEGSVLVLMPTIDLVTQTIRRWREAGRAGRALGVCSLKQADTGLSTEQVVMTRNPRKIARSARADGPFTVFATYASLDRIRDARESFGLPPWDLVVVDEAHRTCSAFGDGWGTIHDDGTIPAKIRLYMTATPRIWGSPAVQDPSLPFMERIPLATMDRREIFGPTVYELGMAEAIEIGILADYQVVLPIVDDSDLHSILAARAPGVTAHLNGLRNAAIQVAVLRAISEHRLRRVLVFHNRIDVAERFAATLRQTAEEVGTPLRREKLWSRAIHSKQSSEKRRDLLEDFANPHRSCAVLSNVRVLNEGVDMPDVDAVVFSDPRYSLIDAIQAIGRGLRQPPGARKKTTLVIPVYLHRGAEATDLLKNTSFATLLTLLQAMRAHDESFMDRIALPSLTRGSSVLSHHMLYAQPERAAQLARALGLEITVPAIGTWEEALAAATAYSTRFGHLNVPPDYIDDESFSLGLCLSNLRLRYLLGRLADEQQQALNALGMRWTADPGLFETMLEQARAWATEHGHLLIPETEEVGGHKLGRWMALQRRKAEDGRLPAALQQTLEALDPYWNPPWPRIWQRKYLRAKAMSPGPEAWRPEAGRAPYIRGDGMIGEWVYRQESDFFRLPHQEQRDLLRAIGIGPRPDGQEYGGTKYAPARRPSAVQTSELESPQNKHAETKTPIDHALEDAAAFLKREGHLDVPPRHIEQRQSAAHRPSRIPLAWWIQRFRTEPHTLNAEQRRAWETILKKAKRSEPPEPPPAA
ncbi:Helicase associated domain protein [Streptomyces sp. NPDC008317]|uniref:DEAD/DEAH box helicase n=1 Tax=Streptomyces sp. NPDC008317 TaxID=3364827 RepID=UPI0036EC1A1B